MVSNNHTYTKQKQSVSLAQESYIPGEAKTPVHQAGTVCRCCTVSCEPGKELTGASTVSLTTGVAPDAFSDQ